MTEYNFCFFFFIFKIKWKKLKINYIFLVFYVFRKEFKSFLFSINLTIFTFMFLEYRYIFNATTLLCSHFVWSSVRWRCECEFHCFHTFLVSTSFVYAWIHLVNMFSIFSFYFDGLIFWNNFTFYFFLKLLYLIIYLYLQIFDNK